MNNELQAGMIVDVIGPYMGTHPHTGKPVIGYDEVTGLRFVIGEVSKRPGKDTEYRMDRLGDAETVTVTVTVTWLVAARLVKVKI